MMSPAAASKHVVTTFLEQPRVVAIVLGHLGASTVELERLSQLYTQRNCAVVAARAPPLDFFLTQHHRLRPIASLILQETASLLRQSLSNNNNQIIPVVIHMFSNGGTFLLEELNREAHVHTEAYGLVQDRLQYIFYDSCPCYLHMPWRLGTFWNKDAFPFPGWSQWGRRVYLIGASVSLSLWCLFTCSLSRSEDFWKAMQTPFGGTSTSTSQEHELIYMYTTADKVTDATRIDELIERQRQQGTTVTAYRYQDSSHVGLLRDHPDDYDQAIDTALQGAIERARAATKEEDR
jgi:hypothetical protein